MDYFNLSTEHLAALIIFSPAAGFLMNGWISFFNIRFAKRDLFVFLTASLFVFISFVISSYFLFQIFSFGSEGKIPAHLGSWFSVNKIPFQFDILIDPLSGIMAAIISLVSLIVHLYSKDYMKNEEGFARYFAVLNLFTAMMLILILSDNIMFLFLGWEGVGLCSYLLIGFYFKKQDASRASLKAFMINRTGDFAFLAAVFFLIHLYSQTGSLLFFDFNSVNFSLTELRHVHFSGLPVIEITAFLLFAAAAAKSAQIPFYTWLPDAMAGPTPVSALIHAATMVTAGIYLILRMSHFFLAAPFTMDVIALTGAFTSILAGIFALFQFDIKKVLAFSTISQLGFIFLALGSGAFQEGFFHLITHAFFKASLFLCAGAILIYLHHNGDMRKMGGLFHKDRLTGTVFFIAALSISGIFPFAGFFSKDLILIRLYENLNSGPLSVFLFSAGLLIAFITPLYIFRQFFMIFFGKEKGNFQHSQNMYFIKSMLILLTLLSFLSGFLNISGFFTDFLKHTVSSMANQGAAGHTLIAAAAGSLSISAVFISWLLHIKHPAFKEAVIARSGAIYRFLTGCFYVDEFYQKTVILFIKKASDYSALFDRSIIDSAVRLVSEITCRISRLSHSFEKHVVLKTVRLIVQTSKTFGMISRNLQTGYLHNYLHYILGGVLILGSMMIWLDLWRKF
ncbi:MAG: NADH-quinone oxidoreductase subunit L [Spirochaetia bacterium]|nr:NADH-quinone oxidoreductase subunit L [Spirochaetia bacterium]